MSRSKLDRPSDLEEAVARANAMAKAFLKSPRARGYFGSDVKRRENNNGSPMLSPPRQTVNGDSLTTGKSKSNSDIVSTISDVICMNQTPSPIQRHLEDPYSETNGKPVDKKAHEAGIKRNLMNAFEMSPIHGSRNYKEDALHLKELNASHEQATNRVDSVYCRLANEAITFRSKRLKRKTVITIPESKYSPQIVMTDCRNEQPVSQTSDADDEGDDEQEDNDVTFGAEVEAASGSSLTTLRSSRRRKSTGSASKLPTTSISDRECFTERKGQKNVSNINRNQGHVLRAYMMHRRLYALRNSRY